MIDISEMGASGQIFVAAPPEFLYDMITDVERMQWSPNVTVHSWDEGAGPNEGEWFTGRNIHYLPECEEYDRHCQVIVANRPKECVGAERP